MWPYVTERAWCVGLRAVLWRISDSSYAALKIHATIPPRRGARWGFCTFTSP